MKKVIFGIALFATGFLSIAMIVARTLACEYSVNGSKHFLVIWELFGITDVVSIYLIMGVLGIIIAIWGLCSKENK